MQTKWNTSVCFKISLFILDSILIVPSKTHFFFFQHLFIFQSNPLLVTFLISVITTSQKQLKGGMIYFVMVFQKFQSIMVQRV
jgi:hypothetical protein